MKMKAGTENRILVDVDGVLLDWMTSFGQWIREEGYHIKLADDTSYSLGRRYGLSDSQMMNLIDLFNKSAAVGFLEPYLDARTYMWRLEELGYRFTTITAFGGDIYSRKLRKQNLVTQFGDVFDEHIILGLNERKDPILRRYENTDSWWIDDKKENALAGRKFGLKTILMRHDHNHDFEDPKILTAHNWEEIYKHITGASI